MWPKEESHWASAFVLLCKGKDIEIEFGPWSVRETPPLRVIGIYNRNKVLLCVYFTCSVFFFFHRNSEILLFLTPSHTFKLCQQTSMNEINLWNLSINACCVVSFTPCLFFLENMGPDPFLSLQCTEASAIASTDLKQVSILTRKALWVAVGVELKNIVSYAKNN